MPASSVESPPAAPPPPPAYPDPIHLPVSPHGDPLAARLLAAAYRTLADRLDRSAAHVVAITADLAGRWHGHGSTALHTPTETVEGNLRALASAYRRAADHLDDYAEALHTAQHHHGWSLGKFIAIGAIVTITAVAVVVTVGAAAPIGTLAAAEVGEAIIGAEAAAAGATAAEAAATSGLALTTEGMAGLRTLTALALPHLTQGAISTGLNVGFHLATGHGVSTNDLAESFLAGTLGSATTSVTRSALRSSEAYAGAGTVGRAALDTAAITATLTADSALQQYAVKGHVNPTALTEGALLIAVTGGASTLRHPLEGTGAVAQASGRRGQTLADIMRNGVTLSDHEGGAAFGHTIAKHVGRTIVQLKARLSVDVDRDRVSSFSDVATAERAILDCINRHSALLGPLLRGEQEIVRLPVTKLEYPCGIVVPRVGQPRVGSKVMVILTVVNDRIVVRTAFVE